MANSVSEAVGDAAKAAVEGLGLAGVTVVKRKSPTRPEGGGNPLPEIVISIGAERIEPIDCNRDMVTYPVTVALFTAGGSKAADDATVRDWRQQIRRKLQAQASWSTVTGWNTVDTVPGEPFAPAALPKDFNASFETFNVEVLESRT